MSALAQRVADAVGGVRNGMARCPAHTDSTASLSVKISEGRVLLFCHAGCHTEDVLAALGWAWSDLFEPEAMAGPWKATDYTYTNSAGDPRAVVERWLDPNGKKFFRQKLPDRLNYGLDKVDPGLYMLPEVRKAAADGGVVYVVEGERDVHAMRRQGVVATCRSGGAREWPDFYYTFLRGVGKVIVIADDDEPGHRYAQGVATLLRSHSIPCEVLLPGRGKDAAEHLAAGLGLADFRAMPLPSLRPPATSFTQLVTTTYDAPPEVVPGLLPTGLTLLGAPPKAGKSYLALDVALAVALGGPTCSALPTTQGSVLYLSLDNDSMRRLSQRVEQIMPFSPNDPVLDLPIDFYTDESWEAFGSQALAFCAEWVQTTPDPRLIVVDTMAKVEPTFTTDIDNAYGASSAVLSRWTQFARQAKVAVLGVHHDRKSADEDWVNRFLGSRGITATASALWLIDVPRGQRDGVLHAVGRDIIDNDFALRRVGPVWVMPDAIAHFRS